MSARPFSFDDVLPLPPVSPERQEAIAEELANFPLELLGRHHAERAYISPSQVKMAARCLEQFRRRYVLGEKEAPNANMVWGSADHEAIADNFKHKLQYANDLPVEDVQTAFGEALERKVEEEGGVTEVVWDDKAPYLPPSEARKKMADVKDRGVELVTCYREAVAPSLEPLAIEHEFTREVAGLPVPVYGHIDLIAKTPVLLPDSSEFDGHKRAERIIERKGVKQRRIMGEWLLQGRVYQLEVPLEIDFQLSVRTKTPGVAAHTFVYEAPPPALIVAQVQRTMAEVAHCYRLYGPEQPWPDAIHSAWACNYCGWGPNAKNDCPWWQPARWVPA